MRGVRTIGIRGGRSVELGETDRVDVGWWEERGKGKGWLGEGGGWCRYLAIRLSGASKARRASFFSFSFSSSRGIDTPSRVLATVLGVHIVGFGKANKLGYFEKMICVPVKCIALSGFGFGAAWLG